MSNPALAQLKDIHLPQAVHWWPPAPGWWLVALLVLALTIWLSRYLLARYRRQFFRGESQDLLKQLWTDYQQASGANSADLAFIADQELIADREFIESTLALLRRAAKTAHLKNPDEATHLESMPSPALLEDLDQHSVGKLSSTVALQNISERLYRAKGDALSREQMQCFYEVAKSWLKSKHSQPRTKSEGAV